MTTESSSDNTRVSVDSPPHQQEPTMADQVGDFSPSNENFDENHPAPPLVVEKSSSFREESNFLSDLKESEKIALFELGAKIEEAAAEEKLLKKEEGEESVDGDVCLWGVPLVPSKCSESTNVVLLKFLRAREFKVDDAFAMLKSTLEWRKENHIHTILDEDSLGVGLEEAAYMDGTDRDGHPVCYNVYGVFQDEKLYERTFGTTEKAEKFVRWRFQLIEKEIQKMDFKPGKPSSIVHIIDLKNAPMVSKKELRAAMMRAVTLLQDNYPEFVAKNIFINVPFWFYAINALLSPFITKRTKSKFLFARSANVIETLLRYIPADGIPTRYGGLHRQNDTEFSANNCEVSELLVKPGSTENIELMALEPYTTLLWDLTVLGWEVNYKEEFVPKDDGSYTVIIRKGKRMSAQEEAVRNSFKNSEAGKIVLTIENTSFKKKKVLFRYKIES